MKGIGVVFLISVLLCSCQKTNTGWLVTVKQPRVPVLKSNDINPVLMVKAVRLDPSSAVLVKRIEINLSGTDDLSSIERVEAFFLGSDSIPKAGAMPMPFGKPVPAGENICFQGQLDSLSSPSFFLISVKLGEGANLHRRIRARCTKIEFSDQTASVFPETEIDDGQRIGVAVRKHNDDHVHTYRIPGLTTTGRGTLLAVYDARRESSRDLQGDIDIGVSRSTDGGNSWEPLRIGLNMGEWGGLPEKFNGVSDACILVNENSDKIFLAALWMHGVLDENGKWISGLTQDSNAWNHQWRDKGSQPGLGERQTSQFLVATSDDDGKSWSKPVNLTRMCKKEEWWLWAPAPGHGITLNNGTLVFPTQGRDRPGQTFSNITFSKDGGETWTTSTPAFVNTTENMVAQLSDGTIMLNARYNPNRNNPSDGNGRVVCTTRDLGMTWEEHPTSRSDLIESTCMASLHRHTYRRNGEKKSLLLFSNPNTKTGRHHMTIKVSFDDGKTWPEENWLLLDEGKSRGYSCLTSIDENTIGILYEGSTADLVFESIPLKEIINSNN
jgi:sialidase-1